MTVSLPGFIADLRELEGEQRKQRLDYVIGRLQLERVLAQTIETLSKGFSRRVGLAQALLHDPPVLILDEPTDGLDPNQKHEVRTLINEMARDKIIVISTHILEEVDAVCTRAIIIARGARRGRHARGPQGARALGPPRRRVPRRRRLTHCLPETSLKTVGIVLRRELASYFATPLAYVFILIFLVLANAFAFYLGSFTSAARRTSRLLPLPALAVPVPDPGALHAPVGRGAQERQHRAADDAAGHAVAGGARQILRGVDFRRLALALTFPIWITVNYLGNPDNGAIVAAYLGSFFVAGGFLAVGSCMSASPATRSSRSFWPRYLLPVPARRLPDGPGLVRALGAAVAGGRHRVALVPHALRVHRQRRDRPARPPLLRAARIFFLLATAIMLDARKSQ